MKRFGNVFIDTGAVYFDDLNTYVSRDGSNNLVFRDTVLAAEIGLYDLANPDGTDKTTFDINRDDANSVYLQWEQADRLGVRKGVDDTLAELQAGTLLLTTGTGVTDISTDGTLVDDSDDSIVTEKAIKTYVDTEIAAVADTQWQRVGTDLRPLNAGDDILLATDTERIRFGDGDTYIYELSDDNWRLIVGSTLALYATTTGIGTRDIVFISGSTHNIGSGGTAALGIYTDTLYADVVAELSTGVGVTIDGVLIQDGYIDYSYISNHPADQYLSAVTVNSISDVDFTIANGTDVTAVDFSHVHSWADITSGTQPDPVAHDLSGSLHNNSTLAALNLKITDATLIDTGDSRLSDAREPLAHGMVSAYHTQSGLTAGDVIYATAASAVTWGALSLDYIADPTADITLAFAASDLVLTFTTGYLQVQDASTNIQLKGDGSMVTTATNMSFQDGTTGPHNLSDLIDGVLTAVNASDITAVDFTITGGSDVLDVDFGHDLDTHDNITITSKQTDDILKWSGTAWINVPIPAGGGAHDMLSTTHTDTASTTVLRGMIITGQTATPQWDGLAISATTTHLLRTDGTDISWGAFNFDDLGTTPTTLSGYGISDTKVNFNTALSDGTFMFTGDAPTSHDFDTHTGDVDLTDLGSYAAQGDLIFGDTTDWGVLTKGTSTYVLKAGVTTISWDTVDWGELTGSQPAPISHALLSHTISGETLGHVLAADSATTYSIRQLLGSEINNDLSWTSVTPAALTKTDDTNVTLTLGGTPATALLQAVSLTLGWTGTLADGRIASAATWNAKSDVSVANQGDNRLITATATTDALNAEANLTFDGTHFSIAALGRIYLDGGNDTYIYENAADDFRVMVGGVTMMQWIEGTPTQIRAHQDLVANDTGVTQLGASGYEWGTAWITTLNIEDANTQIWKDGSNNLSFKDSVTGTKTLAQLASGSGVSFGSQYEIPVVNSTTDDFDYDSAFTFNGGTNILALTGIFNISNTTDSLADNVFEVNQNPATTEASVATVWFRGETSADVLTVDQYGTGNIASFRDGTTDRVIITQAGALQVDTIDEITGGTGVTIDGVLLKDNKVGGSDFADYINIIYAKGHVYKDSADNISSYGYTYSNTAAHCHQDYSYKYGGTEGTPAAAPTDSNIKLERYYVYDGTSTLEIARYTIGADGSISTGSASGQHRWYTRETTGSLTEYMRLAADGTLMIDNISEFTGSAGVTIDSVLLKDTNIYLDTNVSVSHAPRYIYWGDDSDGWDTYIVENLDGSLRIVTDTATVVTFTTSSSNFANRIVNEGTYEEMIGLYRDDNTEGYASVVKFYLKNDAVTPAYHDYGSIGVAIKDHTDGAEDGQMEFKVSDSGTLTLKGKWTHTLFTIYTDVRFANGLSIQAPTGATNTLTFQAYDTDGYTWYDFITLTTGTTPKVDLGTNAETYMTALGSDDTEDHVIAIDDSTGLLSKRSVSSLGVGDVIADSYTTGDIPIWGATAKHLADSAGQLVWSTASGFELQVGQADSTTGIKISSSGSAAYIDFVYSGTTYHIYGDTASLRMVAGSENMIVAIPDGAVELYHNNLEKLETTSSGVDITGTGVATDAFQVDDATNTGTLQANNLIFDRSAGSSYIDQTGGQSLIIRVNSTESAAVFKANAEVELYYDNDAVFETTSSGFKTERSNNGDNTIHCINTNTVGVSARALIQASSTSGGALGIYGYGNTYSGTIFGESLTDAALLYAGSDSSKLAMGIGNASGSIYFGIGTATEMTLNTTGLGIGVAPSTYMLEVSGSNDYAASFINTGGTTGDCNIYFKAVASSDNVKLSFVGGSLGQYLNIITTSSTWQFGSASSPILQFVGSTVTVGKNNISGTSYRFGSETDAGGNYAAYFFHDGNNADRYGIKIACGADSQSTGTHYYLRGYAGNQTTEEGGLSNVNGTFGVYQGSDVRLKTNIVDTQLDICKILMGLRVRDYNRIGLDGILSPTQTGWIAQEVKKVYPIMHDYNTDTDLHVVRPQELIPILHRGWQIHQDRIETIEEKVGRLEKENKKLRLELNKLRN